MALTTAQLTTLKNDILDTVGQPAHWFAGGGAELPLARHEETR